MNKSMKSVDKVWSLASRYGSLTIVMGFLLLPSIWLLYSSFRPNSALFSGDLIEVSNFTFANYIWALSPDGLGLGKLFLNTLIVCSVSAVLTTLFASLAGYGLARYRSRSATVIIFILLLGQMVQGPMIMLPWYQMGLKFDLLDTRTILILIYQAAALPAAVWLMSSFFQNIPVELEESASIDGAGKMQTFIRIIFPLARPGVVAVGLYSFILAWNDYQYALTLTNSDNVKTVQVGVGQTMAGIGAANWGGIIAAASLAVVPVVMIFALVQRSLIEGLSSGAIKG